MTYRIVIQPRAERDLRAAAQYLLEVSKSRAQALRWIRGVWAKIGPLRGCESFVVCALDWRSSVHQTDKQQRDLHPCLKLHVPERLTNDSHPLSPYSSFPFHCFSHPKNRDAEDLRADIEAGRHHAACGLLRNRAVELLPIAAAIPGPAMTNPSTQSVPSSR